MYDTYIVRENDTVDSIASLYGISPTILYELNGYNLEIKPGLNLIVPKQKNDYFDYYKVIKGDTLYAIANKNNINSKLLAQLNGIDENDYIYPNQILLVPKAGSILYFTGIGDTLSGIVNGLKTDINTRSKQNKNIYLQPEQLIVYKYQK